MSKLHDIIPHPSCWRLRKSSTTHPNVPGGHPHRILTLGNTFLFNGLLFYHSKAQAYQHRLYGRYVSLDSQSQTYKSE
jgi:hypothetical protein